MHEITVTEAKNRLTEIIKKVETTTDGYAISRSGHTVAFLISAQEYESLIETLEVLRDKDFMRQIKQSEKEVAEGKVVPFSKIRRDV